MTTSAREVLLKAADLIEPEGRWTQRAWARTQSGEKPDADGDNAACWCLWGAIRQVNGSHHDEAFEIVNRVVGGSAIAWNDTPGRKQSEVVQALRKGAEEA